MSSPVASDAEKIETLERQNRELTAIHAICNARIEPDAIALTIELARIVADATASSGCAIVYVSPETLDFSAPGTQFYPESMREVLQPWTEELARASTNRSTNAIRFDGFEATVSPFPLRNKEGAAGTLFLVGNGESGLRSTQLESAQRLADQVSVQLDRARLFEAERRRAKNLALINELGRLISEQLDLSAVLDAGVRHLAHIADIPQSFLLLFNPTGKGMTIVASNVDEPGVVGWQISPHEPSVAFRAIEQRRPIIVTDTQSPTRDYSADRVARFKQVALLSVPLISRGEPIGAVILGETRIGQPIGTDSIEGAVAVAHQLATAIVNARLYQDSRRNYRKLERAQQQLVLKEKLNALGELAASVAHEVRNPLGVLFNSLASLRKLMPQTPEGRMLLDIAAEETERLNRIVSDLLDFARPTQPRLVVQSLEAVITGAADTATSSLSERNERLVIRIPKPLPAVPLDAPIFRQALVNLMVNALQASSGGGKSVIVSAIEEDVDFRHVARVDVIDTGGGIPAAVANQIFQPFFTTKAKGTGLGLAIVKRIAEAHNGDVSFESVEGVGTTFTLRLPIEPE